MFRVENADFIADKLAAEMLPNQEFREVLKNSLEAVDRRFTATGTSTGGRVEFDVDWSMHGLTGKWYVACADNGDGMSRSELELYTTTLAVQGAGRKQSIRGNQGMGLKISGPTRHKNGVLIRSLKNSERTTVQIGWNGEQYGLIPLGPDGELVVQSPIDTFPRFILEQGSGTVVTFLGTGDADNTFAPSDRSRGWLFRYLNGRFYRLSGDGVQVFVRVPTGDEVDWPHTLSEANDRMRGEGGRSFNLSRVNGTGDIWDQATRRLGDDWHGAVPVVGDPPSAIPPAEIHWWVLPTGPGSDVSSRTSSGGSVAVLFQNELHDWRTSNQANPFFARLGVLYGKTRIAFVIEPKGETITSDFARAHVLVGNTPLFQSDAWLVWADQFRADMPSRIRQTMADEAGKLQEEDPDAAKRIRDRLREVMQLLRPRRFKPTEKGAVRASGESISGAGAGSGEMSERASTSATRGRSASARGIGAVLSQMDDEGTPSTEVTSVLKLRPEWLTEPESENYAIVNGNGSGLHDRAAALVGEDGRTAAMIVMNRDFRGYQAILAAINEWANPEGDEIKATRIEGLTREWINQKMIEAVQGLRQLENGNTWLTQHYNDALSPVALTAAFMADRYHTLREVKRAVGALRQTTEAAS